MRKNERIWELKNRLEHQEKMFEVREQKIRLEEKEAHQNYISQADVLKVRVEELEKRLEEQPYKLVSDMLKALVVKFPTLNIKDLAISTGKK